MAGCGKSTIGAAISKKFNLSFIDTDHLIENKFKMSLENIKKKFGYEHVRSAEEEVILALNSSTQIISTGGSAVYSGLSMKHLKSFSKIIYINTPLETIVEPFQMDCRYQISIMKEGRCMKSFQSMLLMDLRLFMKLLKKSNI